MRVLFLLLIFSFLTINAFALNCGGIDNFYKYAYGDYIGWINFGCDNCKIQVCDDKLIGYAWSENYGWINLNPNNGGIINDGNGNLSGFAWGENLGWINFSGVTIDPKTGEFSGQAIIVNGLGKINFDCSNCKVKTTWRKQILQQPPLYSGYDRSKLELYEINIDELSQKLINALSSLAKTFNLNLSQKGFNQEKLFETTKELKKTFEKNYNLLEIQKEEQIFQSTSTENKIFIPKTGLILIIFLITTLFVIIILG